MRIAIDTGGTFTDCVFVRNGKLEILKVPSQRDMPEEAISAAVRQARKQFASTHVFSDDRGLDLVCGTTVGTNALLERRGGRVLLVTTAGFEDVLEIGRQARTKLYDFFMDRAAPLVPSERRFGLRERIGADGKVVRRPTRDEIDRVVRRVLASGAQSVA